MDRLRISSYLVRIARKLIIANIADDFRTAMLKADPSIDTNILDEMSNFVKSCGAKPKIQKLASYCLTNGFLKWPEGKRDFDTVVRLFGLVNSLNQGMIRNETDYDKLVHPGNYPNDPDCKRYVALLYGQEARQERITGGFNPDTEFKGRKYTDGVVAIYSLKDTSEEMRRVRRALDTCVSVSANPWCLAARVDDDDPGFEPGSENFRRSWMRWNTYSNGPKRIAFVGDRPVAFYANEQWWDMQNISHDELPVRGATDDPEFLIERERYWDLEKRAEKGHLTDEEILEMANGDDWKIRAAIASRKDLPDDLVRQLAEDDECSVRKAIAGRKGLPDDIVYQLAKDEEEVKHVIVKRDDLSDDVIRLLAEDDDYRVREAVAESEFALPRDVICKLSRDNGKYDWNIRKAIAHRKDLPEAIIRSLANDDNFIVRAAIAERYDLPEDVVRYLANDMESWVKHEIFNRYGI